MFESIRSFVSRAFDKLNNVCNSIVFSRESIYNKNEFVLYRTDDGILSNDTVYCVTTERNLKNVKHLVLRRDKDETVFKIMFQTFRAYDEMIFLTMFNLQSPVNFQNINYFARL